MIKLISVGVWMCLVTFASGYLAVNWQFGASATEVKKTEPSFEGIEYHNLPPITVPMIKAGVVQGYVVAKLVLTADAKTLHDFPGDIQPFLVDEVFREIYQNDKIDFQNIAKYNFDDMLKSIKTNVNKRVGFDLVKDVLVTEFNYVDHNASKS